MSVVMKGSARTGEIAPHDQNQQPLEMGADKELAEKMKKSLFDCTMKRKWDKVVRIYKGYPEVHSAKIISSGGTALHVAVSYGEESIVEQLVELISQGGELKMVLQIISTEAKKVLEKTTPRLKESLEKANQASEKFSQQGGNAKEAVQIISDLEAIAGREFSDQLEDGAKKALEIISSKARQAKEIIRRVKAKKALEGITVEAKKVLGKLYEEDAKLKNNISSDDEARKRKKDLEDEAKKAFESVSSEAMKALSEITDHEAKSKAEQKISDFVKKEASETISGEKWKEWLEEISAHLEEIYAKEAKKSLEIKNQRGNTALHLAAERGSVRMCHCIAQTYSEGLGVQNNDQETPFFVAALNGKKEAFRRLLSLCPKPKDKVFPCIRGKDGETILHCAINGDCFDLAFQIISLYPELAKYKTENGLSPLHVLASKSAAFRSGSHLGWFNKIIYFYPCREEGEASEDGGGIKNLAQNMINNFFMIAKKIFSLSINKDKKTEEQSAQTDLENPTAEPRREIFPANYQTCFERIKLVFKAMLMIILGFGTTIMLLIILGLDLCGSSCIRKVRVKKQKHTRSVQVMNQLLHLSKFYRYGDEGSLPSGTSAGFLDFNLEELEFERRFIVPPGFLSAEELERGHPKDDDLLVLQTSPNIALIKKEAEERLMRRETPILIAAKNGIAEMVERILEIFPVAIDDTNSDKKNIVLLAAENRKPHVYQLLMRKKKMKEIIFHKVDRDGNSALHLAAKLRGYGPWEVPGDALQMMREWRWFEYVRGSVPTHFVSLQNKAGQTPKEIFKETHKELVKSGGKWLTTTSQSFSVVAALIATVAFATSSTVPGGLKNDTGVPNLENKPAFDVFAISSLVALCFSVTSLMTFLALLTSRRQEKDFGRDLARRLLLGLTSLFIAIAAMLISFCAGHFFVLKGKLKYAALPVYAVTCLSAMFFAVPQLPLLFDLYTGYF